MNDDSQISSTQYAVVMNPCAQADSNGSAEYALVEWSELTKRGFFHAWLVGTQTTHHTTSSFILLLKSPKIPIVGRKPIANLALLITGTSLAEIWRRDYYLLGVSRWEGEFKLRAGRCLSKHTHTISHDDECFPKKVLLVVGRAGGGATARRARSATNSSPDPCFRHGEEALYCTSEE